MKYRITKITETLKIVLGRPDYIWLLEHSLPDEETVIFESDSLADAIGVWNSGYRYAGEYVKNKVLGYRLDEFFDGKYNTLEYSDTVKDIPYTVRGMPVIESTVEWN